MKRLTIVIISLCLLGNLNAQYTQHIVELKDKSGTLSTINAPASYLSARAIKRRNVQKIIIDSTDLQVSPKYLDSIRSVPGVTVLSVSKWLNQVLIRITDVTAIQKINLFPFVKSTAAIAPIVNPIDQELINKKFELNPQPIRRQAGISGVRQTTGVHDAISYGNSYEQVHLHEGEFLHNMGLRGEGITIAVIDAGYYAYLTNPAFDSARNANRILGGYDFVLNQPGIYEGHNHGSSCFSIMAANSPGKIVGTAPAASYWLLRSEDASREYPVEEHNWAVAAEFADSSGADMISSSLGYTSYDDAAMSHSYADRNGNTAMATIAADLAARKGMIVMNSAGNSGGAATEERFVSVPADGDSVVAVGAIRTDRSIANFSSWGPSASGKVKPNLVSIGQGTVYANAVGNPVTGNGTSLSNPNLAGLFACLWQAFPEFTNMEIINAVQQSADRYMSPDNRFGYGIPNFRIAYETLKNQQVFRNAENVLGTNMLKAYPMPFNSAGFQVVLKSPVTGRADLTMYDAIGRVVERTSIGTTTGQIYFLQFRKSGSLARGVYFVEFRSGNIRTTIEVIKN